ncbi:MAG: dihydrolipoamide acetyltransferase family protein [Chloroflexi bacterium]|nr:dihydrolipoamide acetyltransferase family protein [Chloroflexota bacterium]
MATTVVLPKQGMTMTEGTITEWFVGDGDTVAEGTLLYSFETEKVTYEVQAEAAGTIRIVASVETTIAAGGVAAYILAAGEELPADAGAAPSAAAPPPPAAPAPAKPEATAAPRAAGGRVKASPAAKKLAAEHDLDIATVPGSGPGGRVVVEDVQKAIAAAPPPAAAAPPPLEGAIPYKGMRRTVGQRMHESLQSMAQLTLTMDVDMTRAAALRADLIEAWESEGVRLTYTPLALRAAALALRDLPRVNVTLDGDTVRVQSEVHVGIAVALEEGLIVPVIRNADAKSLRRIAVEAAELSAKARDGGLTPDDLTGGTFTVTALGMFGIDAFTPIVNPPQAAILGIGQVADRPVLVGESGTQIERRAFMTASLTIDHRILDGAPGAQYLQAFRRYLEHPALLLGD